MAGRPKKTDKINPELAKALDDIKNLGIIVSSNTIDEANKDNFLRDLEKLRRDSLPKMKVALVRPGAIFHKTNEFAAGYDLKAFDMKIEEGYVRFMLGIKTEIPKGYYWELVHRSSNSKFPSILANTKGTIDCDFRGEWQARLKILLQPELYSQPNNVLLARQVAEEYIQLWQEGEIALQALLHKIPDHEVLYVDESELSDTQRGEGGHGSTGNGLDNRAFPKTPDESYPGELVGAES